MVGGTGLEPASARLPAEDSVIELTAGMGWNIQTSIRAVKVGPGPGYRALPACFVGAGCALRARYCDLGTGQGVEPCICGL
jgi:hypothetical protein